ncbi:MAG: hypothetical protein ACXVEF_30325 [Polyangiales bacterium]
MTDKPAHSEADDLPELPPLDDDGDVLGGPPGGEDLIPDHDQASIGLDDATSEDDAFERFGALGTEGIDEQGSLLEGSDASEDLSVDEERELLAGAEVGLLEDSDEGDGRDSDDEGLVGDEDKSEEDGGAEGTNEDPAAILEAEQERGGAGDASDDEGIDDDARFGGMTPAMNLEREPWPSHADVAWSCTRVDMPKGFTGVEPATSAGDLVAAVEGGALVISTDSGATFRRVPGCQGVSAITIVSSKRPLRTVAAALHDVLRESTGIVLVRIDDAGTLAAELVADFVAEDDEPARVDRLLARTLPRGVELLACAGPIARVLRPKV